jgi:GAF domain-containing protein
MTTATQPPTRTPRRWTLNRALGSESVFTAEGLNRGFALALGWASVLATSLGLGPNLIATLNGQGSFGLIFVSTTLILSLVFIWLIRRGAMQIAVGGLIVINTFASFFGPPAYLTGALALIGAAGFAPTWLYLLVNLAVLGDFGASGIQLAAENPGIILTNNALLYNFTLPMIGLALVSMLVRFFIYNARRAADTAARSASFLQAGAEIGQIAATRADVRTALPEVANLIAERFNLYYVRIFLSDEVGSQLRLAASSGDTASQTAARREQPITAGAPGAVGQAALRARLTIIRMGDASAEREGWALHTHAQAAFPLLDGERVVGVLDVQSRDDDAFSTTEIQALQIAANQLSTAIRNGRLFAQQAKIAEENRQLAANAQSSLQQIERLNRQLTGVAWQSYLERMQGQQVEYGVTLDGERLAADAAWTPTLAQARAAQEPVRVEQTGGRSVIAVPLTLRGEVIGAIEVESSPDAQPSEIVEMTQAVAQRLATSLENARLYEETGYAAAQEQRINQIAARFQQTTSIDDLLRITLSELSDALGAQQASVRLTRLRAVGDAAVSDASSPANGYENGGAS